MLHIKYNVNYFNKFILHIGTHAHTHIHANTSYIKKTHILYKYLINYFLSSFRLYFVFNLSRSSIFLSTSIRLNALLL